MYGYDLMHNVCHCLTSVQTAVRVGKRLKEIFETALNCHPAVVVLDNLHNAMPRFLDVEEQTSSEGLLSMKKSQGILYTLRVYIIHVRLSLRLPVYQATS